MRTKDRGATWNAIGETLPFGIVTPQSWLTYSAATKTFFLARHDCASSEPESAIYSAGYED
jgi:hypothetical protein